MFVHQNSDTINLKGAHRAVVSLLRRHGRQVSSARRRLEHSSVNRVTNYLEAKQIYFFESCHLDRGGKPAMDCCNDNCTACVTSFG
jgi:hypothetical protein